MRGHKQNKHRVQEDESDCNQHHHDVDQTPDLRLNHLNTHRVVKMLRAIRDNAGLIQPQIPNPRFRD